MSDWDILGRVMNFMSEVVIVKPKDDGGWWSRPTVVHSFTVIIIIIMSRSCAGTAARETRANDDAE